MSRISHWIYRQFPYTWRVKCNSWRASYNLWRGFRGPENFGKMPHEDQRPHKLSAMQKIHRDCDRVKRSEDRGTAIRETIVMFETSVTAVVTRAKTGMRVFYDWGSNTVTDAGVSFLCTDWFDGSTDIGTFKYQGVGTGGSPPTPPAVGVTTLVTEVESRPTGTLSKPAANKIRCVATTVATAPRILNEWGLFSAAAAGTMWSARTYAAINLATSDSIEVTYTLTVTSFTA